MNAHRLPFRSCRLTSLGISFLAGLLNARVHGDVFEMPDGLRSLEFVVVGETGNPPDDTGRGGVAYPFRIGKFEVTTAQYVEFLNAKGKSTPDGRLWFNDMDLAQGPGIRCGIMREGDSGSFRYSVPPELADAPVTNVSFWDAARFCNWLHNGQGNGDTEDGAYTLAGYEGSDGRRIRRNPRARWFLPSEDEWYKAAYYDPTKPGGPGYWDYPTRSDSKPGRDPMSGNAANFYDRGYLVPERYFNAVGAFSAASGPWGTFDQAGNALEWTEGLEPPFLRRLWGGSLATDDAGRNRHAPNLAISSASDAPILGFRVAGALPGMETAPPAASEGESSSEVVEFERRPWRDPETGRPFFPMGWFSYDSDAADLDEMSAEGANMVLFVNSHSNLDSDDELRDNIARMRTYLDHAHRRGIKVLVGLASWYGAFLRNDKEEIARQQQWVEAVCGHPALLGYQLYDEPEYRAGAGLGVEDQSALAEFVGALTRNRDTIRQWDANPLHMTQVVFNLVPLSSWTAYLPAVDSFQVDRYPCDASQAYFGHRGDWGPLIMAWSMAHGAAAMRSMPHLRNPAPCMQGVGLNHTEGVTLGLWRNPLYEETRYMAYSSLTVGAWGVIHWIRNFGRPNSPTIMRNVGRLHAELRQLLPAFEQSYETPPFTVSHNHEQITRSFLTDTVSDISTLALEDHDNYYLVAADNSMVFEEVEFRLTLPGMVGTQRRQAEVLNEDWSRDVTYEPETGEWTIGTHKMCFGDINIWIIPKSAPAE